MRQELKAHLGMVVRLMFSACGKCIHCVTDKEELYLWVCALGHLALSEKIFGCEDQRKMLIIEENEVQTYEK